MLELGVAEAVLEGELESGDVHVINESPNGTLVAVIDGLGHGGEAAYAARLAREELERPAGADLPALVERCHARLKRTRGVVMSLAFFDRSQDTMTWLGVGNVEGTLLRPQAEGAPRTDSILLHGGVIGYQLPRLRPSTLSVAPGDSLIFATDGVGHGFLQALDPRTAPQRLADGILDSHGKGSDDALVLVARYGGES